jgi:hypothetical protein
MAKSRRTPKEKWWTDNLDDALVEEEIGEALVDAYGRDEEETSIITHVENELNVPFRAEALGEKLTVVAVKWPEGGGFGLDLIVERKGRRHRVEARSVNLIPPYPEGHLALAAYMKWSRYTHGDDGGDE